MYLITATYHGTDPAQDVMGEGNIEAVGFHADKATAERIAERARIWFDYNDWTIKVEYNPFVESATA